MASPRKPLESPAGKYAYEKLERLLHERSRLSILSSLMAHPNGLLFADLKELCSLTDGNLSRQLQMLEEVELVEMWKRQQSGRPQTLCRLTAVGRERFTQYLHELEQVIRDAAKQPATHHLGRSATA